MRRRRLPTPLLRKDRHPVSRPSSARAGHHAGPTGAAAVNQDLERRRPRDRKKRRRWRRWRISIRQAWRSRADPRGGAGDRLNSPGLGFAKPWAERRLRAPDISIVLVSPPEAPASKPASTWSCATSRHRAGRRRRRAKPPRAPAPAKAAPAPNRAGPRRRAEAGKGSARTRGGTAAPPPPAPVPPPPEPPQAPQRPEVLAQTTPIRNCPRCRRRPTPRSPSARQRPACQCAAGGEQGTEAERNASVKPPSAPRASRAASAGGAAACRRGTPRPAAPGSGAGGGSAAGSAQARGPKRQEASSSN